MKYEEWLEEKYFAFLETDGLIIYDECPDENPEVREKEFQEWRKYIKEQYKEQNDERNNDC
jgi:hypothetical protein